MSVEDFGLVLAGVLIVCLAFVAVIVIPAMAAASGERLDLLIGSPFAFPSSNLSGLLLVVAGVIVLTVFFTSEYKEEVALKK